MTAAFFISKVSFLHHATFLAGHWPIPSLSKFVIAECDRGCDMEAEQSQTQTPLSWQSLFYFWLSWASVSLGLQFPSVQPDLLDLANFSSPPTFFTPSFPQILFLMRNSLAIPLTHPAYSIYTQRDLTAISKINILVSLDTFIRVTTKQ